MIDRLTLWIEYPMRSVSQSEEDLLAEVLLLFDSKPNDSPIDFVDAFQSSHFGDVFSSYMILRCFTLCAGMHVFSFLSAFFFYLIRFTWQEDNVFQPPRTMLVPLIRTTTFKHPCGDNI